jgi:hypothetical protein
MEDVLVCCHVSGLIVRFWRDVAIWVRLLKSMEDGGQDASFVKLSRLVCC